MSRTDGWDGGAACGAGTARGSVRARGERAGEQLNGIYFFGEYPTTNRDGKRIWGNDKGSWCDQLYKHTINIFILLAWRVEGINLPSPIFIFPSPIPPPPTSYSLQPYIPLKPVVMRNPCTSPVLFLLLSLLLVLAHCELAYIANLYRHGARYPISKSYDSNESHPNAGELSPTGMRQQYNLGRYYRRDYIENTKFLRENYNHTLIDVYSTVSPRTIVSAYCQLYGLYPDGTGPTIPEGLDPTFLIPPYTTENITEEMAKELLDADYAIPSGYQPIPAHDATPYLENCPKLDNLIAQEVIKHAQKLAVVDLLYLSFYQRMKDIFQLKGPQSIASMGQLYDVVACDKYNGRDLPKNFTDNDYLNLRHLTHYIMLTAYSGTVGKVLGQYFFQKVFSDMQASVVKNQTARKWSMFSGHDTNVAPTLAFLNISSADCIEDKWQNSTKKYLNCEPGPDFAANIVLEFYTGSETTVKIAYNGKYVNLCQRNQTSCGYNEFKDRVKKQYLDANQLCGNTGAEKAEEAMIASDFTEILSKLKNTPPFKQQQVLVVE